MVQPAWGAWLAGLERDMPAGEAIESALRWLAQQTQARQAMVLLPVPHKEQVEFAYIVRERAEELRGLRLRPHHTSLEPTLLRREMWSCDGRCAATR